MSRKIKRNIQMRSCIVAIPLKYHPKHKYKKGDKVTIKHSLYSGINVGEVGIVDCIVKQGYGIAFTKTWPATAINEKPPHCKRILFFERGEVK